MTIGSITSVSRNETDLKKINFALGQALQRLGGQQVNRSISVTTTTSYSVLVSDYQVNISGDTEVTLPAASAAPGQIYTFKSLSSGTTATISPASTSNTIDGSTSLKLSTKYQTARLQSNGTTWDRQDNAATTYTSFLTSTSVGTAASLNTSSVLQTTNSLSEVTGTSTTARDNISAAGRSQTYTGVVSGFFGSVSTNTNYNIVESIPFAATLTSFSIKMNTGTMLFTLAIAGTAVGGGTSITATSNTQTVSLTSANTITTGQSITIMTSTASSSPFPPISYSVAYTRTLTLT